MEPLNSNEDGFTLVELVVSLLIFAAISVSVFGLFVSLMHSAIAAKKIAVASSLATNQMEYLRSLPYDSLAIAGGSIPSPSPLPASQTQKVNGMTYTIVTSIKYADDAYDGCSSYPTQELKEQYCRSYPPPASAPAVDSNPQDYKIAHVAVSDSSGVQLAEVDTEIAARVAETASATGALFVSVIDKNGDPVSGATVVVNNDTVSPSVNLSDSTDGNGLAIFYGLPPDTNGFDYTITASKSGYSNLTTIKPSGTLQPTYPSQKIFTQQSSYVTLTIMPKGVNSLAIEAVDTSGNPLPNAKIYIKGGYKKYTSASDTQYYYDNVTPSNNRPTTDSNGLASITNLTPGNYTLCGDNGSANCTIGGVTYYLAAAIPYGGSNPFSPIAIPDYDPTNPPAIMFNYGGVNYLQKVRLILTSNSNYPRISTLSPHDVSKSSAAINSFSFNITGTNLPCSASPSSCSTTVTIKQGATSFAASCTGTGAGTDLSCTVDLSSATTDPTQLVVSANGYTLNLPPGPLLGGIVVTP